MSAKDDKGKKGSRGGSLKELHYRAYKILLRPDRFETPEAFRKYWKRARKIAADLGLSIDKPAKDIPRQVRAVAFYDTDDCDLYKNGFILRQRRYVKDGYPIDSMEFTLKFRHPDREFMDIIDMTPTNTTNARIKLKEAILPGADVAGEGRMHRVFSQNVVYKVQRTEPVLSIGELESYVPAVSRLGLDADTPISLVNDFRISEVSVDLGEITYKDYQANADLSVWRNMATGELLTAEFSWQSRFPEELNDPVSAAEMAVAEAFYERLLDETSDWLLKGTTKTRIVYEYGGRDISCHE